MPKQQNPFTPAEKVTPRLKALVYGGAGVGKTYLALSAPGRIAVIDAEAGSALYAGRPGLSEFDHLVTRSNAEARDAIRALGEMPEGTYETVVVDPITILYEGMQESAREKEIRRKRDEDAELTFRSWGTIGRNFKALATALRNLPMNVIVVAREATDYKTVKGELVKDGVRPDAHKSSAYDYDTIIRMHEEKGERLMTVEKDRSGLLEVGKTYRVPDVSEGSPFEAIFGDIGKGSGYVVPDTEAAINADAEDMGAPAREEAAGPELGAEIIDALDAIGKDSVAVLGDSKYSDRGSWADVPKEYALRVLDRARTAAKSAAEEESAPEPSGAEGQSSAAEEEGDPSWVGPNGETDPTTAAPSTDGEAASSDGEFASKVNQQRSKGRSGGRKES